MQVICLKLLLIAFTFSPVLASAKCKKQTGHYYDPLLKRCIQCAEICGGHPEECSQYCQSEY